MLQKKSFVKKTKGGKVVKVRKGWYHHPRCGAAAAVAVAAAAAAADAAELLQPQVVREHYLRDDIW